MDSHVHHKFKHYRDTNFDELLFCNTNKTQMKKITEKSHFPSKQTYPGLQYTILIEKIEIYYEREREGTMLIGLEVLREKQRRNLIEKMSSWRNP